MTAAPPGARSGRRARRGRVLVVGDDATLDAAREHLSEPPIHVRNLFDAIGEIARSRAGAPVVTALVDGRLIAASGGRAAEAMRRLDPSVRLVRLGEEGTGAGPAAGFDESISAVPRAATAAPAAEPPPRGARSRPNGAAEAPPPRATPAAPALDVAFDRAPPPPATPQRLGDTDLVAAIMNDAAGAAATALGLIREHTGWGDVELRPEARDVPEDHAQAEVRCGSRGFGVLVARTATTRDLAPWAEWLGHWLDLDRSYRDYRRMAFEDDLTGAWNRRYFDRFLSRIVAEAAHRRRPVTVMVFDIDDFKRYNDAFGHAAGDVILCETVALLKSVIRASDRVRRIGGDEFAVIFADLDEPRTTGSSHPESVEAIARRFQAQIGAMRFPKLGLEAPGTLSISAGLSTFPWDGRDAETLLRLADERALASKRKGKNDITFGPGATGDRRRGPDERA